MPAVKTPTAHSRNVTAAALWRAVDPSATPIMANTAPATRSATHHQLDMGVTLSIAPIPCTGSHATGCRQRLAVFTGCTLYRSVVGYDLCEVVVTDQVVVERSGGSVHRSVVYLGACKFS